MHLSLHVPNEDVLPCLQELALDHLEVPLSQDFRHPMLHHPVVVIQSFLQFGVLALDVLSGLNSRFMLSSAIRVALFVEWGEHPICFLLFAHDGGRQASLEHVATSEVLGLADLQRFPNVSL